MYFLYNCCFSSIFLTLFLEKKPKEINILRQEYGEY